ncbi:hypothetical protein D3C76_957660 [compost metagenome]
MTMNHRAVSYRDILTGYPFLRILRPCFNGDAVITHIDIAVADADIHTRLWVNAVCIRRIRRIIDRQIINRNIMATDRIHSPAWGVHECQISERDSTAVVEADKLRAGIQQ